MDKVIKDGKVAVIHSPDFGGGWESSVVEEVGEEAYFCPAIVEKILERDDAEEHLKQEKIAALREVINEQYLKLSRGAYFAPRLSVKWVPQGLRFFIIDYDGYETVCVITPELGVKA
jgi:hypothetical protein